MIHSKKVPQTKINTFIDDIMENLDKKCWTEITYNKHRTITYNIWHITRIEDICTNILMNNGNQVLNDSWIKKINCNIIDTGNALTPDEISQFSSNINIEELLKYRIEVGKTTQRILKKLQIKDMKRKVSSESLKRIIQEKAVSEKEEAVWLIDFWGKKTVAGLVLMPLTRHQLVHLNDCVNIKNKCLKSKKHV